MSKVYTDTELSGIELFRIPEIDGTHVDPQFPQQNNSTTGPKGLLTAERIAQIQAQAYQEGFAQGRNEGLKAGATEIREKAQQLETLMVCLNQPLKQLDAQVEQELLGLVLALTRQLIRREMKREPGQILSVIREAMTALPASARNVRLHLHAEDAVLVRESLSLSDAERDWQIMEDPVLTKGDCRVVSDSSQIDASLETRLNALISSMLGGERIGD